MGPGLGLQFASRIDGLAEVCVDACAVKGAVVWVGGDGGDECACLCMCVCRCTVQTRTRAYIDTCMNHASHALSEKEKE